MSDLDGWISALLIRLWSGIDLLRLDALENMFISSKEDSSTCSIQIFFPSEPIRCLINNMFHIKASFPRQIRYDVLFMGMFCVGVEVDVGPIRSRCFENMF